MVEGFLRIVNDIQQLFSQNFSGPQSTDKLFVHIFLFSELIHNSWTNPHGLLSGFCLVCLFYFCFAFCFLRQEDHESQFSPFKILEIFKLHMIGISLLIILWSSIVFHALVKLARLNYLDFRICFMLDLKILLIL